MVKLPAGIQTISIPVWLRMLLGAAFGRVRCGTCALEGASVHNTLRQTLNGTARDLDTNVIERFMARENNMQPTGRSTAAHEYGGARIHRAARDDATAFSTVLVLACHVNY